MKIFRPMATNSANPQLFGENKACIKVDSAGQAIYPTVVTPKSNNTCPVGFKSFYDEVLKLKGHTGEDWSCWRGEPIYFPVEADTMWYSKDASDAAGGLGVDVCSKSPVLIDSLPPQAGPRARAIHTSSGGFLHLKFRFWHALNVWPDKDVAIGEKIMLGDSTGASSGDHVHWCMKFCDAQGNTIDNENGYGGAVDFRRWFRNMFILEYLQREEVLTGKELARKALFEAQQALREGKVTMKQLQIIAKLFLQISKLNAPTG